MDTKEIEKELRRMADTATLSYPTDALLAAADIVAKCPFVIAANILLEKERDDLRAKLDNTESTLRTCNENRQFLRDELASVEEENGTMFSRLEVLKDECKSLNETRDTLAAENAALHRWQNGLEAEIKELRFKAEENARLLAGCEQAEKLVNAGGYTKWQDGAWWIFWECNGEVAAGPAKSLYDLALILSNAEVADPKDSAN